MPAYEFRCRACGEQFTKEMPIAERAGAEIICPACAKADAEQVYRAVNINTRKASCDDMGGCGARCAHCCHEC